MKLGSSSLYRRSLYSLIRSRNPEAMRDRRHAAHPEVVRGKPGLHRDSPYPTSFETAGERRDRSHNRHRRQQRLKRLYF